jgi:hypothetical protein
MQLGGCYKPILPSRGRGRLAFALSEFIILNTCLETINTRATESTVSTLKQSRVPYEETVRP